MKYCFEGFEYDGAWFKEIDLTFNGKFEKVDVQINGYGENEIPNGGKEAFLYILNAIEQFAHKIGDAALKYYQDRKKELGYECPENSSFPNYKNASDILSVLHLKGITIPDQEDYTDKAVFLVFDCAWDKENGIGIRIVGDKIEEIGGQDIAL